MYRPKDDGLPDDCFVCGVAMVGHPRCPSCGLLVGKSHEAARLMPERIYVVMLRHGLSGGRTKIVKRKLSVCDLCDTQYAGRGFLSMADRHGEIWRKKRRPRTQSSPT
jgi:hypothetical protein